MNTIRKTTLSALAIATISLTALGAGASDANAGGWKKFKKFHHFHHRAYHYNYDYGYHCKPKYRKLWVWSPRKGRKVLRWVRVGKRCY